MSLAYSYASFQLREHVDRDTRTGEIISMDENLCEQSILVVAGIRTYVTAKKPILNSEKSSKKHSPLAEVPWGPSYRVLELSKEKNLILHCRLRCHLNPELINPSQLNTYSLTTYTLALP